MVDARRHSAVKCALTNISPKKLMLGTDWRSTTKTAQRSKTLHRDIRKRTFPSNIEAMLGGNAARLLGL